MKSCFSFVALIPFVVGCVSVDLGPSTVYGRRPSGPRPWPNDRGTICDYVLFSSSTRMNVPEKRRCREIIGDLTIEMPFDEENDQPLQVLSLPNLRRVEGSVTIRGGALRAVELPVLRVVGGEFELVNTERLEALDVHDLRVVGGNLTIAGNARLEGLSFARLREIGGGVLLGHCRFCAVVDVPRGRALWHMGVPDEQPNARLTTLQFESLESIGRGLAARGERAIERLDLMALRHIGSLELRNNSVLREVRLPHVEHIRDIEVQGNGALSVLGLSRLRVIELGSVLDDRAASAAELDSLDKVGEESVRN